MFLLDTVLTVTLYVDVAAAGFDFLRRNARIVIPHDNAAVTVYVK